MYKAEKETQIQVLPLVEGLTVSYWFYQLNMHLLSTYFIFNLYVQDIL